MNTDNPQILQSSGRDSLFARLAALALIAFSVSCTQGIGDVIIPKPVKIEAQRGWTTADRAPEIVIDSLFQYGKEGYVLDISKERIKITAGTETGVFYAIQSLEQLKATGERIHCQKITDYPRFEYRGVHLDVSRHFRDKEFVKKQLRMLASLKINRFHFHLCDAAGWRLQIDRYPLLTEVAAWRTVEDYKTWRRGVGTFCTKDTPGAYGGFYTKDDIREILALADSLHITVVPEIEMFGHSSEVTAVYPELACGKAKAEYDENGNWKGGAGVYCVGKEKTFEFLENVLDEVIDLFPSEYIHIGGDEANKRYWRECPDCQKRIAKDSLDGEDGLQSYGISRIEKFVNSRGRQIIGWDEILEGGLAPNAAVMSWRGEEGGRQAAAAAHKVVMTPGLYCYLDKCQGNPETEPVGFGGYLSVRKVYSYDPAPETMDGREYVMGVQTNLWTELVRTPEHAEHMLYPRVFALSEVAWSVQEERDFDDFRTRAIKLSQRARQAGYEVYDMTLPNDERPGYDSPKWHKAKDCPVSFVTAFSPKYPASGEATLTDGYVGNWSFGEGWLGWADQDCCVVVDLGSVRRIKGIASTFGQWKGSGVFLPLNVRYEISSDGENFTLLEEIPSVKGGEQSPDTAYEDFQWNGKTRARYVKVTAKMDPEKLGWVFTDEIIVK